MKVSRFFELALEAIDDFLGNIQKTETSTPKIPPYLPPNTGAASHTPEGISVLRAKPESPTQVICIHSPEKMDTVLSVFDNSPKEEQLKSYAFNIGYYLNKLLQETASKEKGDSCKENLPTGDNKDHQFERTQDFFFLGTEPLSLVHNPQCSSALIEKHLLLIKGALIERKEQLLKGWQIESEGKNQYLSNTATADDWKVFFNCGGSYEGTTEEYKKEFLDKLDSDTKIPFECRVGPNEFFKLLSAHGLYNPYETIFRNSLRTLLEENEEDEPEEFRKQKNFLLTLVEKTSAPQLVALIKRLAEKQVENTANGVQHFYLKLQKICLTYDLSLALIEEKQKPEESTTEVSETEITRLSPETLKRAGFSKSFAKTILSIESQCIQMAKVAKTLAPMKEPFDPHKESVITDIFLSIEALDQSFMKLESEFRQLEKGSALVLPTLQLLNQASKGIFHHLLDSLFSVYYRQPVIQFSEAIIRCIEYLRKVCNPSQATALSEIAIKLKDNFVNSILFACDYKAVNHWLDYFKKINNQLYSKDRYEHFFQQANDLSYESLMAHLALDFRRSRDCLDEGWAFLENGIRVFVANFDADQVEDFFKLLKLFSMSISFCYRALGAHEFEVGEFHEARTSLQRADERTQEALFEKARDAINLILQTRGQSLTKGSCLTVSSKDETNLNPRWCDIEQLLTFKQWLSRDLSTDIMASEEDGRVLLSSSNSTALVESSEALKRRKIAHKKLKAKIIIEDFASIDVREMMLSAPTPTEDSAPPASPPSAEEQIHYERLLAMHYKSLFKPSKEYMNSVVEAFELFSSQCQDPLLKLKTLQTLICHRINRLLISWISNEDLNFKEVLDSITGQVKEARACAESIKTPEASRIMACIDLKLKNYQVLSEEFLRSHDLVDLEKKVAPYFTKVAIQSPYCLAFRLGSQETLSLYESLKSSRELFISRPLCFDLAASKKRRTVLERATILACKLAYELWSVPSLLEIEANTKECAVNRLQDEYRQLLDLKKTQGFNSDELEPIMILTRTTMEETPSEDRLPLFNQAFSKVKNQTDTVFSTLIFLKKIDFIMGLPLENALGWLNETLVMLSDHFKKIKSTRRFNNETNLIYIILEASKQICAYTALSQRPIHTLPADLLRKSFNLQLELLALFKGVARSSQHVSAEEARWWLNEAEKHLNYGLVILDALDLETKLRKFKRLLPALLSSVPLLKSDFNQCPLTAPSLIDCVLSCRGMREYTALRDQNDSGYSEELNTAYQNIASMVLEYLETVLPRALFDFLRENEGNWFEKIAILVQCQQAAHSSARAEIAADSIPLLRGALNLYPDNPTLIFSLAIALTRHTPKEQSCPELIALCQKAADLDHPQAQYEYARLLQKGHFGAQKDEGIAQTYLEKSYAQGYFKAQYRLAQLHRYGLFGYQQDSDAACTYAKEAVSNDETPYDIEDKLYKYEGVLFIPTQDFN